MFFKKYKYYMLLFMIGIIIFFVYINIEKEVTDNMIKIKHPEEDIEVIDKNTLLKYKPDFEHLANIPVYSLSKEITLRYLGFIDGLEYIYDNDNKLEVSSDDEYIYFQIYAEVETNTKIDDQMIDFFGKVRGENEKINVNKEATTFYSNEIEHGVQHGIVTFELERESIDITGDEPILFDVYINWDKNTYSTERIKDKVMLKEVN